MSRKALSAEKVKKLSPGTDVLFVRDSDGAVGRFWVVKSGRKKLLKGVVAEHEIMDRKGYHYEIEVD